jgi:hypothetical protein
MVKAVIFGQDGSLRALYGDDFADMSTSSHSQPVTIQSRVRLVASDMHSIGVTIQLKSSPSLCSNNNCLWRRRKANTYLVPRHRAAQVEWSRQFWYQPSCRESARDDVRKVHRSLFTRMWGCKLPSSRAIGVGECMQQDNCMAESIIIRSEYRGEYSQGETV